MDKVLNSLILGRMEYDYYKLLGVERNANQQEIKSAYRRKAKAFHPDAGGPASSHEYFQVLLSAYQTLSDPLKRKLYDTKMGLNQGSVEYPSNQGSNSGKRPSRFSNPLEATPFAFRSWVPPKWVRVFFYCVGVLFSSSLIYFTMLNLYSGKWGWGMSWIFLLAIIILLDSISGIRTGFPVLGNRLVRGIRKLFSLRFDG